MIVRIAGVTLPSKKRAEIALTSIFGIGRKRATLILRQAHIDQALRTKDLTEQQVAELRRIIEQGGFTIEGELRREIIGHVRRLKEIGSYRGSRHARGLPARGQRTKTNSRTRRGNVRRTMGSGRKPAASPT